MPIPVVNAVLRLWSRLVKEAMHSWYTLLRPAFVAASVASPGPPGEPLATGAVQRLAVGQARNGPELDAKAAEAKGVTHPTKPPVSWAVLTRWGFTRDFQRCDVIADWGGHGGTDKAVCLWSQDLVDTLEAEGHKVRAGTCGENLTVSISKEAWAELEPGDFFWLPEPEILLQVTEYAGPCKNQGEHMRPPRREEPRTDQIKREILPARRVLQPHQPPRVPGLLPPLREGRPQRGRHRQPGQRRRGLQGRDWHGPRAGEDRVAQTHTHNRGATAR